MNWLRNTVFMQPSNNISATQAVEVLLLQLKKMSDQERNQLVLSIVNHLTTKEKLDLSASIDVVETLDYAACEVFLKMFLPTEYPRRLACQKEPMTVRWIENHLKPGDVMWDIGANVGAYSLLAAKLLKKEIQVYAFEPSCATYASLCRNIKLNGLDENVRPFPIALGNDTGVMFFNYTSMDAGTAMHTLGEEIDYQGKHLNSVYRQEMLSFRIDDLVNDFGLAAPNHLKIDVDGTEMEVLEGASGVFAKEGVKSILIEISERRAPAAIVAEYLSEYKFIVHDQFDRPCKNGQSDVSYRLFVR